METRLIDAYDQYKDFEREAYFVVSFDAIPSEVFLEIPLKDNKENMEDVLSAIPLEDFAMKVVYKQWQTKDDKRADNNQDFAFEYLFKSDTKKLLIWIDLSNDELDMNFLYDVQDTELENWVLSVNDMLRKQFGKEKKPTFKVLVHEDRKFQTKNVQSKHFEVNIKDLYNDDFQEIHQTIIDSIDAQKSGLILLHGSPGTGKTSYIKSLISTFEKKTFIFIQNEFINDLLRPDFISFLLKHKDSILLIEDAEKVLITREYSNENSVVSTILQLTDGLFSDYLNIKIICTFNTSIQKIDKALMRKGRMLADYEFKALSKEKTEKLLKSEGYEANNKEMVLADIFNYNEKENLLKDNKGKIGF